MRPIPCQIAKLIPRLASEHDGEVVAVVRAIDRLLRTASLDWHTIAERVGSQDEFDAYSRPQPPWRPQPSPAQTRPQPAPHKPPPEPSWSDLRRSEQLALCALLLQRGGLDEKTRTLIAEVQGQLYIGQNFYLAPRHKRLLTKLLRTTRPIEGEVA